ncbi:MAG: DegT/DnrJ/EryC1/StrS family aminotransferase [SAR324 cluster bacterium]|nr:DegT/DnrJ/EryC1/StrS family aminotransferase [SAR324 cluster bacterium]
MPNDNSRIAYVDLSAQWKEEQEELLPIVEKVLSRGQLIGGDEVDRFEEQIKKLCQVQHAIALNSGTDALIFALMALGVGPGDEVITPPNSFIASTAAVVHIGAKPVFVDVLPDQNINPDLIERAITKKTKAIMPVHLTGRVADMTPLMEISNKYGLPVVEDAAQAIGSRYDGKMSGAIGAAGCFSAHPLKNLNACGDSGFLTTNDEKIARFVRLIRNHGLVDRNTVERFGLVSRMDTLHAAILNYRLSRLDSVIERRRNNAEAYFKLLNQEHIFIPPERAVEYNTYHTFVIQIDRRDELKQYLLDRGIETAIHYPIPIHLQPAAASLGYKYGDFPNVELQSKKILTLPIHQTHSVRVIERVAETVNSFFHK